MRVLRESHIAAGFIYYEPVDGFPALMHCGAVLCRRGHQCPPHTHAGFEFLYVSRGSCSWQTAGRIYRQPMGTVFITRPHETHGTGPVANLENRHLWLGLRLDEIGPEGMRVAREVQQRNIRLLPGCEEVEPLLQAIISQVSEMRPQRTEVVTALLHSFIAFIMQRILLMTPSDKPLARSVLPYSYAVQRAISCMQQNLDRRLELREFAAVAAFRSAPHFCTQFHREVGVTPSAYHMQLRLEAAREMLHQPEVDITCAALEFGFSSSQHFSTLFRRAFGLTPGQWKLRSGLLATGGGNAAATALGRQ